MDNRVNMESRFRSEVSYRYRRSASNLTMFAHLFGILSVILMLIWILHYRGNIEYNSDNQASVFNVSFYTNYQYMHIFIFSYLFMRACDCVST